MRFFPESGMGAEPFYTPANIEAQVGELSVAILGLQREIADQFGSGRTREEQTFIANYNDWVENWKRFALKASNIWGSNLDIVNRARASFATYQDRFIALGGRTLVARPAIEGSVLGSLQPLLYVGLAVVGLWAISNIVGSISRTGHFDKERR